MIWCNSLVDPTLKLTFALKQPTSVIEYETIVEAVETLEYRDSYFADLSNPAPWPGTKNL